jgi:hypothetical protein
MGCFGAFICYSLDSLKAFNGWGILPIPYEFWYVRIGSAVSRKWRQSTERPGAKKTACRGVLIATGTPFGTCSLRRPQGRRKGWGYRPIDGL